MKRIYLVFILVLLIQNVAAQCGTSVAAVNVSCYGACNGSITFTPGSGTPPYSLSINGVPVTPFSTSYVMTNACVGNYYWVLYDALALCADSGTVAMTQPSSMLANIFTMDVTCAGASNGTASINVAGGTPPYSYLWSPFGGNSSAATNLSAGVYSVSVTDTNGCVFAGNATINEPPPMALNYSKLDVNCYGDSTGAAAVIASGGTGLYSYMWLPLGYSNPSVNNLFAGNYTAIVTDANGCVDSVQVTINEPPVLNLSVTSLNSVICFGTNTGSVCMAASGGVSPYSYTWLPSGSGTACANNLPAGIQTCTVSDINGCIDTVTVAITEPPAFSVSVDSITNVSCFGGNNGSVRLLPSGGIPPYSNTFFGGLIAFNYVITVMDSIGCLVATNVSITQPASPLGIADSVITDPSCHGGADGSACVFIYGGTAPYTCQWSSGDTILCANYLAAADYFITATDANGCIAVDTLQVSDPTTPCDSVWPGDANWDGVADNFDILILGVNYNDSGPVRPGATNAWTAQACPDWNDTLANGLNGKHSDCDGNGIVNADDTLAVFLNYGMIHARSIPHAYNAALPDFMLKTSVDSAGLNQALRVKMYLGSAAIPAPPIYGIAFTLTWDPLLVDSATAFFDFSSSALGTAGVNMLTFQHSNYSSGKTDITLSRTDHSNVIMNDSLLAEFGVHVSGTVPAMNTLQFGLADVKAITWSEDELEFNLFGDSVLINPAITGIQPVHTAASVLIYPVPAKDRFTVKSTARIFSAGLFNALGEKLFYGEFQQPSIEIATGDIPDGIYFLQLHTGSGWITKSMLVHR